MGFYVGDIPAEVLMVDPDLDLDDFATATVEFRDDSGAIVADAELTAEISDNSVDVSWPTTTPFATSGVFYVGVILHGASVLQRLSPVPVVVDAVNDGWHTLDSIRERWLDAPQSDIQLYELLWSAKNDVTKYAPSLVDADGNPTRPPTNYKKAQQMQTRNLWNASKVDPGTGGMGDDTFVVRPFPLDWSIKQLLRPSSPYPVAF